MPVDVSTRSADALVVDRLRAGDEAAFAWLVDTYSASLMRVARTFVPSFEIAEEVVQETWLAVVAGIQRFEARSSLKTWLFSILINRAKTRARRESRTIPFSDLYKTGDDGPTVDPTRFLPPDHPRWPGHWAVPPEPWRLGPEGKAVNHETLGVVKSALERLPPGQRVVVALRDVDGWPATEVCAALGLSEANQRVLLHRGRSRLRAALAGYFADEGAT